MSLINKMLRDLNTRHASEVGAGLPEDVRPLPEVSLVARIGHGRLLAFVLLALLVLGGGVWLVTFSAGTKSAISLAKSPSQVIETVAAKPVVVPTDELPPLPTLANALPLAPPRETTGSAVLTVARKSRVPAKASSVNLRLDDMLSFVPQRPPEVSQGENKEVVTPVLRLAAIDKGRRVSNESRGGAELTLKSESRVGTERSDRQERSERSERSESKSDGAKGERTDKVEKIERGERGDENFRNGVYAYKQGRMNETVIQLQAALRANSHHAPARQALLGVFVEQRRLDEAIVLLREGLELVPGQTSWAMALARIQVERGHLGEAWETLQKYQSGAEQNADYQAFAAVLLQHFKKPHEAVQRYKAALRIKPREGRWWFALGNALEADNQAAAAVDAFKQAEVLGGLTPAMAEAVTNKLR